jgi:hypothetical protein
VIGAALVGVIARQPGDPQALTAFAADTIMSGLLPE